MSIVQSRPWPSAEFQAYQDCYDFDGNKVRLVCIEVPDDAYYFQCQTCDWLSYPTGDPARYCEPFEPGIWEMENHACTHLNREPMFP